MAPKLQGPISLDKLEDIFSNGGEQLRPILTNLNDDNAWLLSCPRPAAERAATGRIYYHIALDPWLTKEGANLGFSWILGMKRTSEASAPDAAALGALVDRIEAIASMRESSNGAVQPSGHLPVDAIFISNESGDHCHFETLSSFPSEVPVFAAPKAAQKIAGWKLFNTLIQTKSFNPATESWQVAHPGSPLPEWITPIDIVGHTVAHFGLAIIISSQPPDHGSELHELIALVPHGLLPTEPHLQNLTVTASPPIKTLALMHPLKESWTLGVQIYLGVSNALAIIRQSQATYYVKTADLVLDYTGFLSYALSEKPWTLQSGLEEERKVGGEGKPSELACHEVANGKCLVLV